jgi:hypothetical protein
MKVHHSCHTNPALSLHFMPKQKQITSSMTDLRPVFPDVAGLPSWHDEKKPRACSRHLVIGRYVFLNVSYLKFIFILYIPLCF